MHETHVDPFELGARTLPASFLLIPACSAPDDSGGRTKWLADEDQGRGQNQAQSADLRPEPAARLRCWYSEDWIPFKGGERA
jgi:hypothetical protein